MYSLREATMEDALNLLQWKNNYDTRKNSIVSEDLILWINHLSWVEKRLTKPGIYLILDDTKPCGDVRFDIGEEIEVSIRIAPKYRGKGVGRFALGLGCMLIRSKYQKALTAKILDSNVPSQAIFRQVGFEPAERKNENGKDYTVYKRG